MSVQGFSQENKIWSILANNVTAIAVQLQQLLLYGVHLKQEVNWSYNSYILQRFKKKKTATYCTTEATEASKLAFVQAIQIPASLHLKLDN